ncbi:two-component system response regulator [Desulfosarcina widdelii]|uniref:Two-component system response regulator n=1 Tax=Desulfosarcina widdelii TaxID=947919 RepID=A0A5K7Z389_9BACT|nr:HD domain-containing phosphohydrolase [Desulfosarcina widdelii]BBO75175.1 two-component system response regulator [Desulfosarcina widdelii]
MEPVPSDDDAFSTVLVVDDDDDIREILSCGISSSGCRCLTADSAESALKVLASQPVEVVISDVQMEGMGGLELCRHVKEDFDADVIIITGLVNNFAYEEIIARGASDFIEKPIRLAEIVARLKRVLMERQTRQKLRRTAEELRQNGQRFQKAMEGSVQAIALAVEMRDPYTAGHQSRVADLACAIARSMDLSEDRIYGLKMASVIHDLGKLTIPGEILCKPGRLSGPEYAMIRTHVQSGYDILKKIDFPWPLADIVIQHHERIDGSGYPQGLSGDEILLEARILSVADVFETIGSHRPYRPSLGIQKAINELAENSGRLYDADVVAACLKLVNELGYRLDGPKKAAGRVTTQMQSL